MKGINSYKPKVGESVLISSPNEGNENGYMYTEHKVLWLNDTFILYGIDGCWPNLHKLNHVHIKKISQKNVRIKIKTFKTKHLLE